MIFDLFSSSVFLILSMIHVFHLKSESLKDIWVGILQQLWEDLSCITEWSEVKRMNIGRRKKHRKPFKNLIWIDWKKAKFIDFLFRISDKHGNISNERRRIGYIHVQQERERESS